MRVIGDKQIRWQLADHPPTGSIDGQIGRGRPPLRYGDATPCEQGMIRQILKLFPVSLLLFLLPVFVLAQQGAKQVPTDTKVLLARTGTLATSPSSRVPDANYVIGPEDLLDISVWKEPELTRTVPVRPDGKISLPLLNDVQAAGQTPTDLAVRLTESLRRYVNNPQVTVIVTAINSQHIYLLGEVTRPGAYPLLPGMTVLQALSSAGGLTQYARTQKIYVLRDGEGGQTKVLFNYKNFLNGKNPEQNVLLQVGDTIVVP
jgi:polysaccharide biosynthesis/export protein